MFAVYKRELHSFFYSVIGWIFMAAILFFVGLYFSIYNLGQGYPYVAISLSSCIFVMMIAVPILTMRIMTEDRKQNTDQLLYTAPIRTISVILGKYFAMLTVFVLPLLLVCLFPIFLGLYGSVPYLETYISIMGFFVFGAACIAIGQFVSSLTENQIVAAVGAFLLLFLGYMMSGITSFLSTDGNLFTQILNCYSFYDRVSTFFDGVLDIPCLLYFITLSIVFLFFTYESLQRKRFSMSTGKIKRGAFSTGLIAVVIAAAVLINYGVSFLPGNVKQIDVTNEGLYQIGEQTKSLLESLDTEVTIYALASKEGLDSVIDKLLTRYTDVSKMISVEYKDPTLYPEFYTKYAESMPEGGSLIVESEKRSKLISYSDLYEMDLDYTTYSQTITGFDAEGQITSAISYVLSDDMPILYQICGHEELALSGELQAGIEKQNVQIETMNLMDYDEIPMDAAGIVILAPTKDYSEDDAKKVSDYLNKGGKALVISSWNPDGMDRFNGIFEQYGMTLEDGVVVDPASQYYYQSPYYLLPDVNSTAVSSDIQLQNRYALLPYAQGITVSESDDEDAATVYQVLTTSEEAYSKVDTADMDTWEYEDGDIKGPFAVCVYVTKQVEGDSEESDNAMEFMWATTENILSENADATVAGTNYELVNNMIARMKGEEVSLSIPAKQYMAESFTVPRSVFFIGFSVTTIIIPLLLIAAGLIIWFSRRKR